MTKIEWVQNRDGTQGKTWNPVTGCTPRSLGCAHCYAERMARRLAGRYGYPEYPHHFDVTLRPDRLDIPLRRRKPTVYFVCSMSDLFHEDVPIAFLHRVFNIFARSKQHIFQVLTKRPERMAIFTTIWTEDVCFLNCMPNDWVLPNVHLGVSVENQAAADARREYLRQCPAAVKFVSYEPALGPVDWTGWEFVSQIISGGESGPGARPSHPDWHRATRDFCQKHSIAYFFKQWGAWSPNSSFIETNTHRFLVSAFGLLGIRDKLMYRVGKKAAGRLLDGHEWNEMPRAAVRRHIADIEEASE